ncbi:MAG: NPP1 family protein [Cyanobacteria bacterium SBLK]|nr:NPP1 family protein [Cyanobacteria bacterium SBLK]
MKNFLTLGSKNFGSLRWLFIIGCIIFFIVCTPINGARSHDFERLDVAVPNNHVLQLAPVFDFDGDGCLPSAGISRRGQQNGGLQTAGSITGQCRSRDFLRTSNTLHRSACTVVDRTTYCSHFYALYFEKDQIVSGRSIGLLDGHLNLVKSRV